MGSVVLHSLKNRGVKEVQLFVSDGLNGIENAIASTFSSADMQLCVVHLERNILKHIKPKDKMEVGSELKEVFQTAIKEDTIQKGWKRWSAFIEKNEKKYSVLSNYQMDRYRQYFICLKFDYRVRSMIFTTNWIERLNKDYKRTTKMRGALPNPEATILLLGYVVMNRNVYTRKVPKLDYEKYFKWDEE